jgi:hypothetical protein
MENLMTNQAEANGQRRFRISIRGLMIAVALCALLLAPLVWMFRQTELRMKMERLAAENARVQAAMAIDHARSAQVALNATKPASTSRPETGNLWAALTINHPVFTVGQTKDLRIQLCLVNEVDNVIDPKIPESRIVINGKELTDSGLMLRSAAQNARFTALAPGESIQLDCLFGDHFKEPGTYRVSWEGVDFQSSEIEFRILPQRAQKPKRNQ